MNMKFVKTDVEGLVIDPHSKAVINMRDKDYNEYLQQRSFEIRVKNIEGEISNIRDDLKEVKDLVKQLIVKH